MAEVERSLLNIEGVKEAVALAHRDRRDNCRLAGYVVAEPGANLSTNHLRSGLSQLVPDYMIPSSLIVLKELPRTAGGKVNSEQLQSLASSQQGCQSEFAVASNSIEAHLVHLWEAILNVKSVGIRDDFFNLGGDSLSAAELFAEIERAYGRRLPASTLLNAPSIEQLAKLIEDESQRSSIVPIRINGSNPPLFCVHGIGGDILSFRHLASYLSEDQPVYGLRAQDGEVNRFSVESIAECYVRKLMHIQPDGPYFLAGYSFGGIIAFEMAQQLNAQGKQVGLVALFDTHGPGYPRLLPAPKRLMVHLRNMLRADREARLEYLRERIRMNAIRINKSFRRFSYK